MRFAPPGLRKARPRGFRRVVRFFFARRQRRFFSKLGHGKGDQTRQHLTFFVTQEPGSRPAGAVGNDAGIGIRQTKTACIAAGRLDSGGSGEIRTRDQRIKSPLLYRLSYRPGDLTKPGG